MFLSPKFAKLLQLSLLLLILVIVFKFSMVFCTVRVLNEKVLSNFNLKVKIAFVCAAEFCEVATNWKIEVQACVNKGNGPIYSAVQGNSCNNDLVKGHCISLPNFFLKI